MEKALALVYMKDGRVGFLRNRTETEVTVQFGPGNTHTYHIDEVDQIQSLEE